MPHLFALDQNFPEPIARALQEHLEENVELVPIRRIDARLPAFEDWQILHALHVHGRPWDGLITTDANMLSLPRELSVLCQTHLSLVVAIAAGHDPIKATGLVLAHIGAICSRTRADTAQVWRLRTTAKQPEDPWQFITELAGRREEDATGLYRRERLAPAQLHSDPLA
ncbi:MAG: nucleolar 14 family protein [Solirubrobacterales bacterium]|nr:nucleolar 14 family protein [Solirubrobacterales bacterium]